MYEAYKRETDKLIKLLVKNAIIITMVIFIITAVRDGIEFVIDWRMFFLWALPIYYWLYILVTFLSRNKLLNELKEENLETETITVKNMSRHDKIIYSGGGLTRKFSSGILKYKIKDTRNETYYFEDIIGGERVLPKVKSYKAMKGVIMEITYTKKTHYIIAAKFEADKDTNFLKQEMKGYFK